MRADQIGGDTPIETQEMRRKRHAETGLY